MKEKLLGCVVGCVAVLLLVVGVAVYQVVQEWAGLIVGVGLTCVLLLTVAGAAAIGAEPLARAVQTMRHAPVTASDGVALAHPRADGREMAGATFAVQLPRSYRIDTGDRVTGQGNRMIEQQEEAAPSPIVVPSFADMMRMGMIGDGALRLGMSAEGWQALDLSQDEPASYFTAGLTQTGKSTDMRSLAAQAVANGARLLLCDPHGRSPKRSLAQSLTPLKQWYDGKPALGTDDPMPVLQAALTTMRRRLDGAPADYLLVLLIDELNRIARNSGQAFMDGVASIVQEGAKVGVITIASGQMWTASSMGNNDLRNSGPNLLVHRTAAKTAMLLPGVGEYAHRCARLEPGTALFVSGADEPTIIAIPNTTDADIAALAERMESQRRARFVVGETRLRTLPTPLAEVPPTPCAMPVEMPNESGFDAHESGESGPASLDELVLIWRMFNQDEGVQATVAALASRFNYKGAPQGHNWHPSGDGWKASAARYNAAIRWIYADGARRGKIEERMRELAEEAA